MNERPPKTRLFTAADLAAGDTVPLAAAQARHLFRVMRLGPGAVVALFNGHDGEWRAVVDSAAGDGGTLRVLERLRPQRPEPDLWLAFAPLKKTATDFVVEKATELGVSVLQPVFSRLTATRRVNCERLAANAAAAAEQCRRLSVPEVREAAPLPRVLAGWPPGRTLLALDESGGGEPIAEVLARLGGDGPAPAHGILSGPEGGFAASELDALRKLAFVVPVGLGPRILRAETAAVAALACWQAALGDWRSGADA